MSFSEIQIQRVTVVIFFIAFDSDLFLYGLLICLFTAVVSNQALRHLIAIYISSHTTVLFSRHLFSSRIDLHRWIRRLPRWLLMDCASTRGYAASNTSRCLTRQIFTGSVNEWEYGYFATRGIRCRARLYRGEIRARK